MIVDRALLPEAMVKQGRSGSLQMVDYTLIELVEVPDFEGYHQIR